MDGKGMGRKGTDTEMDVEEKKRETLNGGNTGYLYPLAGGPRFPSLTLHGVHLLPKQGRMRSFWLTC